MHVCMSACMLLAVCMLVCPSVFVCVYARCPSPAHLSFRPSAINFILDRLPLLPAQLYHGTHLPRTIHRVHAHRACLVRREPMTCPDPESIVSPPDRFLLSVTFLRHNTL